MILYQKAFVIKIILIRVFTPYYASCSKTAYTTSQRLLKRSLDLFRGKWPKKTCWESGKISPAIFPTSPGNVWFYSSSKCNIFQ